MQVVLVVKLPETYLPGVTPKKLLSLIVARSPSVILSDSAFLLLKIVRNQTIIKLKLLHKDLKKSTLMLMLKVL